MLRSNFLVFVNQLSLFSLPLTQSFSSRRLDYTWLVIRLYTAIWPNMALWQHMSIWLYTAVWQPSCSRLRTRNPDRQHSYQLQRAELFNYTGVLQSVVQQALLNNLERKWTVSRKQHREPCVSLSRNLCVNNDKKHAYRHQGTVAWKWGLHEMGSFLTRTPATAAVPCWCS